VRRAALGALSLATATLGCGADDGAPVPFLGAPTSVSLVRPDTPNGGLLWDYEPGDVVTTHPSAGGSFLVHFVTAGPNAVPVADADASGVPDFVEDVAATYDEVLGAYTALGFRAPLSDGAIADNGGDDRFDVYLLDFAGIGDGTYRDDACSGSQCAGFMVQENDYAGYGYPSTTIANRILGSHEFFHAIQAAYDTGQGSVMAEGSAVWATETFDGTLDDFEYFLDGYLDNPDRSLDAPLPGPTDPFSYGAGLYFRFLEERYGDGTVQKLWQRCEEGANGVADPLWFSELDPLLAEVASTSFAEAFVEFARWNLYTSVFADPAVAYVDGAGYPRVAQESVTAPFQDDQIRMFYASARYYGAPTDGRAEMTAALVAPPDDPGAADGLTLLLVARDASDNLTVVEAADATAGLEGVDTSAATRFVAVVVNGATEGDSKKPGLCLGTKDEVASCIAALGASGAGGGGGAGGGDGGGGSASSGDSTGNAAPAPSEDDGGCGCRVPSASGREASTGYVGYAALASLLAFGARRRRNPRAANIASVAADSPARPS
jgi:MYXO-CTERM domain-containing protein